MSGNQPAPADAGTPPPLGSVTTDQNPGTPQPPAAPAGSPTPPAIPESPTTGQNWIPEKYRDDPQIKDFNSTDASDMINSYKILNERKGRSVLIPTENAGKEDVEKFFSRLETIPGVMREPDPTNPEAMNQFWTKAGRPPEANGYQTDFGENNQYADVNTITAFKDFAFEKNLTSDQFKSIVEFDLKRTKDGMLAAQQAKEQGLQILKEKWGTEFKDRSIGVKAAMRVYEQQFPDHFKMLEELGGNNPAVMQLLSDVGMVMKEKGLDKEVYSGHGNSPEVARQKLDEIESNRDHPFNHPEKKAEYEASREEVYNLYREIEGEQPLPKSAKKGYRPGYPTR